MAMNPKQLTTEIQKVVMEAGPKVGINELCRICVDKGLPVSKHLVAQVRNQVRRAVGRADGEVDGLTFNLLEAVVEKYPEATIEDLNDLRSVSMAQLQTYSARLREELSKVPSDLERQERLKERLAAAEAERERKAQLQAEREAKWAARAKEREAKWAAEAEAAKTQQAEAPLKSMTVGEFMATAQEEPVPIVSLPPIEEIEEANRRAQMTVKAPHPEARRRTTAGMMMRRQRLNDMLDADPGLDPLVLMGRLKEEFGVALDWRYVYDTCRVARELHGLPQVPDKIPHARGGGPGEPLPTFPPGSEDMSFAETPEEEFAWLARQANDIMRAHGLTELSLVVESGKAKWRYTVVKKADGEIQL